MLNITQNQWSPRQCRQRLTGSMGAVFNAKVQQDVSPWQGVSAAANV
jgi:hypothetical protein